MYLPETISNEEDLRIIATIMKNRKMSIPIMGFRLKNGERQEALYAYARANEAGDNILLETQHVKDTRILESWTLYPQIVDYLKSQLMTA